MANDGASAYTWMDVAQQSEGAADKACSNAADSPIASTAATRHRQACREATVQHEARLEDEGRQVLSEPLGFGSSARGHGPPRTHNASPNAVAPSRNSCPQPPSPRVGLPHRDADASSSPAALATARRQQQQQQRRGRYLPPERAWLNPHEHAWAWAESSRMTLRSSWMHTLSDQATATANQIDATVRVAPVFVGGMLRYMPVSRAEATSATPSSGHSRARSAEWSRCSDCHATTAHATAVAVTANAHVPSQPLDRKSDRTCKGSATADDSSHLIVCASVPAATSAFRAGSVRKGTAFGRPAWRSAPARRQAPSGPPSAHQQLPRSAAEEHTPGAHACASSAHVRKAASARAATPAGAHAPGTPNQRVALGPRTNSARNVAATINQAPPSADAVCKTQLRHAPPMPLNISHLSPRVNRIRLDVRY